MSIESIINQSLDLIGYKRHIGSIWDGSQAARVALNAFSETRDEALALRPWEFARAHLPLTLDSSPAPQPWLYAYARPEAAIEILDVYSGNLTAEGILDPRPVRWTEAGTTKRIILIGFSPAAAMVTYRVTDTALWPPDFTLAVIRGLAEKLQRPLAGAPKEQSDGAGRRSEQRA